MSLLAVALTCAVAIFLVVTLIAQHREWGRTVAQFDPIRIVPRWTFFAPNPAVHDTNLIVRVTDPAGQVSNWQAVQVCGHRRLLDVVWNPNKRIQKMVSDLTQSLMALRAMPKIGEVGCPTTLPYILLLHCCARAAQASDGSKVEFAIIRTSGRVQGSKRLYLLFRSGIHSV